MNRLLAGTVLALVVIASVIVLTGDYWIAIDLRPGSPVGQSFGITAAVLLLASAGYLPLRRAERPSIPRPRAQQLHAFVASLAETLAIVHSHFSLRQWSTLVLLALVALWITGVWGRIVAPRRIARTFGRSALAFQPADRNDPMANELGTLRDTKQKLLQDLDATAKEGRFVLRTRHWLAQPKLAYAYHQLHIRERRLMARAVNNENSELPVPERWWRFLHLVFAGLFIIGLIAHVITTVFFAGYVAAGRQIYWWHLTAW